MLSGPTPPQQLEAPRLLAPAADATIPQNDGGIGCPEHWARGFGFEIRFDWEEPRSAKGITGYDILVQRRGAAYALVEDWVPESRHVFRACNGFVIDQNLDDWEWRVRAVGANGMSEWSEARLFRFGPCRTTSGQRCWGPAGEGPGES